MGAREPSVEDRNRRKWRRRSALYLLIPLLVVCIVLPLVIFTRPVPEPNGNDVLYEYLQTELEGSIELPSTGSLAELHSLDAADLDGDGVVEIVGSGQFQSGGSGGDDGDVRVWSYDASTNTSTLVASQPWFGSGATLSSTVICDIDKDGTKEIVIIGHHGESFAVSGISIWNYSSGHLNKEAETEWERLTGFVMMSLSVNDIDGDGDLEIVTAGYVVSSQYWRGYLGVWRYTENGGSILREARKVWHDDDRTRFYSVVTGDIDGDGSIEIITAGKGRNESESWLESEIAVFNISADKEISLKYLYSWPGRGARTALLYKLDQDEIPELIVADTRQIDYQFVEFLTVWQYSPPDAGLVSIGTGTWSFSYGGVHLAHISRACNSDNCGDHIFTAGRVSENGNESAMLQIWRFNIANGTVYLYEHNSWGYEFGVWVEVNNVALADVDLDGRVELLTAGTTKGSKVYEIRIWAI